MTIIIIIWFILNTCFIRTRFINFYILLETVFLIMFLYLFIIRKKIERELSSYYILIITITASLPVLAYLLINSEINFSFLVNLNNNWTNIWGAFIYIMFLIKIPIFTLHIWLPKAHVEATLSGSVILSGILLKLGIYGILRITPITKLWYIKLSPLVIAIRRIRRIITAIIIIRQSDIKNIVAYSSVVHIRVALSAIFSNFSPGLERTIIMSYSHGLRSPIIFFCTYIIYIWAHSRRTIIIKGAGFSNSTFIYLHLIITILSIGLPPTIPFFSEFLSGLSILIFNLSLTIVIIIIFFTNGIYLIYFFTIPYHGKPLLKFHRRNQSQFPNIVLFTSMTLTSTIPTLSSILLDKTIVCGTNANSYAPSNVNNTG